MEYLRYQDTEWIKTGTKCPRDGQPIYREVKKKTGIETDHFCCQRMGCTWPNYHEKELSGLEGKPILFEQKGET